MIEVDALHAVAGELGIAEQQLIDAETATTLAGTFRVTGAGVAALTLSSLQDLIDAYHGTVHLTVKLGQLEELSVGAAVDAAALANLVAGAAATPVYDVVMRVDKPGLLRALYASRPVPQAVLFFHQSAASSALLRGLTSIQRSLWADPTAHLVIVIADRDSLVEGDMLTICGGAHIGRASTVGPPQRRGIDPVAAARRRDDFIGWDTQLDTDLTPWHFAVDAAVGDEQLVNVVDTAFATAAVLFTCDRARALVRPGGTTRIQAEFRGHEHVAFVPIDPGRPLPDLSDSQRLAIRRLIDWCYQPQDGDRQGASGDWLAERLPFVQTRIAQALAGRDETTRFRTFVTAMPEILEGATWQWRAFLEGRVSDHLDRVQKLEATVADTVEDHAKRTAALVDGLSSSILAAVAALIGSLIAAAYKTPFNSTLFRIGMLTYAVYVLIFPGLLGSIAARGHADQVDASFAAKRVQFEQALYPDKVREIVGERITLARARFDRWWSGILACYLAISIAVALAAAVVPSRIA